MGILSVTFYLLAHLFAGASFVSTELPIFFSESGEPNLTTLLIGVGVFAISYYIWEKISGLAHSWHHFSLWWHQ